MIEKLDNNEQVLLMYLADELPAEDRLDVEQMLKGDDSLRQELQRLQAIHQIVDENLARLDELSSLPIRTEAVARVVGSQIRQRLARPKAAPRAPVLDRQPRSWRWLYPTAAAAIIIVGAMVWLECKVFQPVSVLEPDGLVLRQRPTIPEPLNQSQPSSRPQSDSDLLMASLESSAASDQQEVVVVNQAEAIPQDDVNQYLLNLAADRR